MNIRDWLQNSGKKVYGRVVAVRRFKQSTFIDLLSKGVKHQLLASSLQASSISAGDTIEIYGISSRSKLGNKVIKLKELKIISKWHYALPFRGGERDLRGPMHALRDESYGELKVLSRIRRTARNFLDARKFLEIQTPVLTKEFNGGVSYPISTVYLNERLGYNRTTFEDRHQAVLASGHERIYEIGSIFRGGKERTLLEGYAALMTYVEGKEMVKSLISTLLLEISSLRIASPNPEASAVIAKRWNEVDFISNASQLCGVTKREFTGNYSLISSILEKQQGVAPNSFSPEKVIRIMTEQLLESLETPCILFNYPVWSSPLYAQTDTETGPVLQRGRLYVNGGDWGFEFGIQENDSEELSKRLQDQQKYWGTNKTSRHAAGTQLKHVLQTGVPKSFGFAMSIDRVLSIFNKDYSIDPYGHY